MVLILAKRYCKQKDERSRIRHNPQPNARIDRIEPNRFRRRQKYQPQKMGITLNTFANIIDQPMPFHGILYIPHRNEGIVADPSKIDGPVKTNRKDQKTRKERPHYRLAPNGFKRLWNILP